MDLKLKGKSALVLAGSSGLGKGAATELAREGARVMLLSTSEDKLRKAQKEILEATGNEPAILVGDLSKPGEAARAVEETVKQFGGIDVLVTNAPGPKGGPFLSLDWADWDSAYQLSLMAHVQAIRAAVPHMQAAGGGRVLCITSYSIKQAADNLLLSNAFRLAVLGVVKTLSRELAPQGILLNVIGTGPTQTPRIEQLDTMNASRAGVSLEEWTSQQAAKIPLGRLGQAEEIAHAVAFLASPKAGYITGHELDINGGMYMR